MSISGMIITGLIMIIMVARFIYVLITDVDKIREDDLTVRDILLRIQAKSPTEQARISIALDNGVFDDDDSDPR